MLYRAIEGGVNYIDTAYPYHQKASEPFLGRALQGGWRQRVRLATKMPHWMMSGPEEFDRYFDEQLAKLQTDYVDFYLLHGLDKRSWAKLKGWDVFAWAEKRIAEGRIHHLGFSFHDDLATFKDIVDGYDWSFCQIQYNYMDIEEQAGTQGLQYAASKGLAVVVMEPLLGGKLAARQADTRKIWDTAPKKRKPAEWALHWLWSQPEVSVVLSGMSTMQQVEQNLKTASASRPGLLSPAELAVVDQVRETYRKLCLVSCTGCQYCQPCPNELNIPLMFELYNAGHMYGVLKHVREAYKQWIPSRKTRRPVPQMPGVRGQVPAASADLRLAGASGPGLRPGQVLRGSVGLMFVFLSKFLPPLLYPLGLSILLPGPGAGILQKRARLRTTALVLALLIFLIASNSWVALSLARSLEWRYLPTGEIPSAAAIVLLGGGTESAAPPRPMVEVNGAGDRILYAAQLYRQGKAPSSSPAAGISPGWAPALPPRRMRWHLFWR